MGSTAVAAAAVTGESEEPMRELTPDEQLLMMSRFDPEAAIREIQKEIEEQIERNHLRSIGY